MPAEVKDPKILQINYNYKSSADEYVEANKPYAQPFSEIPGLRWKIWLINDKAKEAGGIYLFQDGALLQAFLNGPEVAELRNDPSVSNVSIKTFDAIKELSTVTRAPLR